MDPNETKEVLAASVALKLAEMGSYDEDTIELATNMAEYVVHGWYALSGGDLGRWKKLVEKHSNFAVASICSMITMAHAIRIGQGAQWSAEVSGKVA